MLSSLKRRISKNRTRVDVETAIDEIRQGRMLIVTDSEDRENEGDLVAAADCITHEQINFMAKYARGLICTPLEPDRASLLDLNPMVKKNEDSRETAFTVSIDAAEGITTGISAHDRCHTIRLLTEKETTYTDFVRPGHIFPLVGRPGGVLIRAGHTEASIDLCRLAGRQPVGVICEIMKEDGSMARMPDLEKYSRRHDIKIVTIADLIEYRRKREEFIEKVSEGDIRSPWGPLAVRVFKSPVSSRAHLAITRGPLQVEKPVRVRVHSEKILNDLLFNDGASDLFKAADKLFQAENSLLLVIRERDSSLIDTINGYHTEKGDEAADARHEPRDELREIGIGAQILALLGVRDIRLMTNNPRPVKGLEGYDLRIVETIEY